MNGNDLNKLKILKEITGDGSLSQRALAGRLNVSLGFVNGLLKNLVNNNYCMINVSSKKKRTYVLTEDGHLEKTRLTYELILASYGNYHDTKDSMIHLFTMLESKGIKKVIFLGAGKLAFIASNLLKRTSMQLVGIIDPKWPSDDFLEIKILDFNILDTTGYEIIIVTAMPQQLGALMSELHFLPSSKIYYLDNNINV